MLTMPGETPHHRGFVVRAQGNFLQNFVLDFNSPDIRFLYEDNKGLTIDKMDIFPSSKGECIF